MRAAVGFLTVIPVRAGPPDRRGVTLFPLVGLVIGAAWLLAAWVGHQLGGPLVAAGLVLAVDLLLTGGLHLDGLADTADGLASRRPPDRVRAVMKDPRIGAVGAAALATTLLVRFALLAALVTAVEGAPAGLPMLAPAAGWVALTAVPVVGRCALVCLLPGARPPGDSLASGAAAATGGWTVAGAAALTGGLVVLTAGPVAVVAAALAVAFALAVAHGRWRRRLGGSGDLLGAGSVLAELAMLAGLLSVPALA